MVTEGTMSQAVADSLADAALKTADGAAKALAVKYAALMDEAAPKASYEDALKVLADVVKDSEHPEAGKAFRTVSIALAGHTVASDLGPKLLAVLVSLGMTPAGRQVKGGGQDAPVKGPLGKLREEHSEAAAG